MGKVKSSMEFITKESARNTTYIKRKRSLIKKCYEFSTLCNVPICMIIYPYKKENEPSTKPEVYSFQKNGSSGSNHFDLDQAQDPKMAQEILKRYLEMSTSGKTNRALNLFDMLDQQIKKANHELNKLRHENASVKYPTWNSALDGLDADQLMNLLVRLDHKLDQVNQRIAMIKGNQVNLVPFVNNPTNMINDGTYFVDYSNMNQIGYLYNKVPSYVDYPITNNGQYCNEIVPLTCQNGLTEEATVVNGNECDHNGGNLVVCNYYNYNMNVNMMGTNQVSYDQVKGFVGKEADERVGSSSGGGGGDGSSSGGLPMAMPIPLHFPMTSFYKWENKA